MNVVEFATLNQGNQTKFGFEEAIDVEDNLSSTPAFVIRAERAMRRAAKNVLTQHRALELPVIVWRGGKAVEKPV